MDQGKIFVSRWFRIACARLNVRHLVAKPYSPEAKGKIERFMGTVDSFLAEVRLRPLAGLKDLNEAFQGWLEEGYNHKPHSALEPNETPASTFAGDTKKLRFATAEELREAFLHEEDRQVDRTGCFKLHGRTYDAGPDLAGKTVEVRYDPFALEEVEMWLYRQARMHGPGTRLNQPRQGPEAKPVESPGRSRYLDVLAQKEKERRKQKPRRHLLPGAGRWRPCLSSSSASEDALRPGPRNERTLRHRKGHQELISPSAVRGGKETVRALHRRGGFR